MYKTKGDWYYIDDQPPPPPYKKVVYGLILLAMLYYCWTLYRMCAVQIEQEVAKDRIIAASSACNEQVAVFKQRLDCDAVQQNLDSRTQSARVSMCWIQQVNPLQSWKVLFAGAIVVFGYITNTILQALLPARQPQTQLKRLKGF